MIESKIDVRELAAGPADPPLILDRIVLPPMLGNWPSVAWPDKSEKPGWVELGTPEVEIVLIHWLATGA